MNCICNLLVYYILFITSLFVNLSIYMHMSLYVYCIYLDHVYVSFMRKLGDIVMQEYANSARHIFDSSGQIILKPRRSWRLVVSASDAPRLVGALRSFHEDFGSRRLDDPPQRKRVNSITPKIQKASPFWRLSRKNIEAIRFWAQQKSPDTDFPQALYITRASQPSASAQWCDFPSSAPQWDLAGNPHRSSRPHGTSRCQVAWVNRFGDNKVRLSWNHLFSGKCPFLDLTIFGWCPHMHESSLTSISYPEKDNKDTVSPIWHTSDMAELQYTQTT